MVELSQTATIITGNEATVLELERRIGSHAGFHEVRADLLGAHRGALEGLLAQYGSSVILTLREAAEGGTFDGEPSEKLAFFRRALSLGVAYIDLELSFLRSLSSLEADILKDFADRIIVSVHLMEWDPALLERTVRELAAVPCHGVKLALFIGDASELILLRDLKLPQPVRIVIGMGQAGLVTRQRPSLFGSDITYAPLEERRSTVAFQPTLERLTRWRRPDHRELGVLALAGGMQIRHSPGIAVYNALFEERGLPWQYVNLPTARATLLPSLFEALGARGASVTMPLKADVAALVTAADEWARRTGVVNTVAIGPDGLSGWNTDAAALAALLGPGDDRVLILGTGSTATSAFHAAGASGRTCVVTGRTPPKDVDMRDAFVPWNARTTVPHEILVNTTPLAMAGPETPWPWPTAAHLVVDLALTNVPPLAPEPSQRWITSFDFWCLQGALQMTLLTGESVEPQELSDLAVAR